MEKTFDRNNVEIKVGDKVIWYDPAIDAMDYAYWLGELGFHHGYIEEILRFLQFLTK